MEETHGTPEELRRRHGVKRQYLTVALVAVGISLLLSPPWQPAREAKQVKAGETSERIDTEEQLTIRVAQELGSGRIGVASRDFGSDKRFTLGADREFDAASTMKLVIVGFMYHEASNDRFDLDQVLTLKSSEIQKYGTGVIYTRKTPHRYTWRELARLMMEKSDNTAAFVLAERLDQSKLQRFADEQGMATTSLKRNTTTPRDMLRLLERVESGEMADETLTAELLGILDDSDFEERIPAKLPEGARVFHKTGDAFNGGQHDVGIVDYRGHRYAVAIFTERVTKDVDLTRERMANASRDIFSYYLNR